MLDYPEIESQPVPTGVGGWVARTREFLPQGGSLPPEVWARRHTALLWVLLAHAPLVFGFALVRGFPLWHAVLSSAPVAAFWFAARNAERRTCQECLCAAGLVTASSMLVHLSGGVTEMHFHFFVVVALLTLYQDWLPFLTALVLIVFEHGVIGVLWPHQVYDHASAWRNPWLWALIHGLFVLAASVASLAAWGVNERDHRRIQVELERLRLVREDQLRYQTQHDPLTGLGNRRLLTETLDAVLANVDQQAPVALLFVDLDGFKLVNDLFGHDVGDLVLVEVSRRIAEAVRPGDTATRLGGDEFVVLCVGLAGAAAGVAVAQRIEAAVALPISTAVGDVRVTASVGIACSEHWPHEAERLLHEADLAMYRAKQLGKGRCQLFDADLRQAVTDRDEREATLRYALDHDGLRLLYQPIFNPAGEIRGVEALLRLVAADGGLLAPMPYIVVAEETGLISVVSDWVLTEACRQLAQWRRDNDASLVLNVNISGRELGSDQLADRVLTALAAADLPPGVLALEITETAIVDTGAEQVAQLRRLLDAGVNVGIDDFGTGYSSLQYLRRLPINFIKIDGSFVDGLPDANVDRAIVAAIVTLSRELGLKCVAEGVETVEQRHALGQLDVGYLQGYLLARPESAEQFAARLDAVPQACLPDPRQPLQSARR